MYILRSFYCDSYHLTSPYVICVVRVTLMCLLFQQFTQEVNLRKSYASTFNQTRQDFDTDEEYNDYLEMVQDIFFDLVHGTPEENKVRRCIDLPRSQCHCVCVCVLTPGLPCNLQFSCIRMPFACLSPLSRHPYALFYSLFRARSLAPSLPPSLPPSLTPHGSAEGVGPHRRVS